MNKYSLAIEKVGEKAKLSEVSADKIMIIDGVVCFTDQDSNILFAFKAETFTITKK